MEPRVKFFDKKINSKTYKMAYYEWGQEDNAKILLCIHGFSRNGRDFDYLAKEIASKYRVICVDMFGRGQSDWLADSKFYNYNYYIADIIDLIQHLNLKKLDIIGTSMGGIIAMFIAAFAPNYVNRLILNDIGPFVTHKSLKIIGKILKKHPTFKNLLDAKSHYKTSMARFGINNEAHWDHIVKYSVSDNTSGVMRPLYDPAIMTMFAEVKADIDLWEIWNKIKCNILILRGEKSDILTEDIAQMMCLDRNKKVQLAEFTGIGHAPALMDNNQIKIITKWLLS